MFRPALKFAAYEDQNAAKEKNLDASDLIERFNRWSPSWNDAVKKAEATYWLCRSAGESEATALRAALETALSRKS